MAILKEFRCRAHGAFENTTGKCPSGCPKTFVVREIRTAPAYRRPGKMAWVDRQMREIAAENGLSDMRSDPKAGLSVLDMEKNRRALEAKKIAKENPQLKHPLVPTWMPVKHAQPGFSARGEKAPTVDMSSFGTRYSNPVDYSQIPKPRPFFVKRDTGGY